MELSYTLESIGRATAGFWEAFSQYKIIAFSGEMGAGKTTFIHSLCDYLGVEDVVSSPTFALINEYHFYQGGKEQIIYHLDWYRLRDSREAFNAGMDDCIEQARSGKAWCFIEWPEKAPELLLSPYIRVSISSPGPAERIMIAEVQK